MLMLVGLGNPGTQYALNRHNIGFMVVDALAHAYGAPGWRKKFQAEITDCTIGNEKVLLVKPQTYMNDSGRAVQEAAHFYKLAPKDIVVVHDELDLAPFKLKLKLGGGTAGHNGLKSIQSHLGTPEFRRLRFGIGHPGARPLVLKYVLGNFSKAELDQLPDHLGAIADEAASLITGDDAQFLSNVARQLR